MEQKTENHYDEPLIVRKTPILILFKIIITTLIFNILFIITSIIYVYIRQYYGIPLVRESTIFVILLMIEFLYFAKIIIYWLSEYMYVTDLFILYKTGIFNIQESRYNNDKINNIEIKQSLLGQLLRYGDIHLSLTNEKIVTFYSIPYPKQFVFLIANKIQLTKHIPENE